MVVRIPSGLFFELLKYARENRISVNQLTLEFIRYGLSEKTGWKCPHDKADRKWSRKTRQWYCSNCYTFFDVVTVNRGKFEQVARKSAWEIKKTMSEEEWSSMIKPNNEDLK